jgi:hypothetical protein
MPSTFLRYNVRSGRFPISLPKIDDRHCPAVADDPLAVLAKLLSDQDLNIFLAQAPWGNRLCGQHKKQIHIIENP